jgi:4-amino-4-deoxy-L-arabinose transferase-like glycosyltransferase
MTIAPDDLALPTAPPTVVPPDTVPLPRAMPVSRPRAPLLRGRPDDPVWVRPALLALLAATLVFYLWGLAAAGWANSFYSAAAQAGSVSWKAFFFGSSDAANSITVDKPPLSLWPAALAIRIFGLNSWSILVPQALMGVATVGVLYVSVRRWFSAQAGLIAGLVMAFTPVAALMFRFNNPDALLTLLMTTGAYVALRAVDDGRRRWFVLTGVLIGLGFLTKQLQVLLVVPPFAFTYLVFGHARCWRRIGDLAVAGVAMIVAAGWWVAIVSLWPASSRPYIGGSQTNSILELTFGYNGFGRLTGDETGSVGGGGLAGATGTAGATARNMWGATGISRMFGTEIGGQIAWLIPAALVLLVTGLWITRRAPRTDVRRASLVLWGSWLLLTGLTFSFMSGIFHAYYTVALAPPIAALVGIGSWMLWERRARFVARFAMAALTLGTGIWAASLLGRAPTWQPWLSEFVLVGSIIAATALVVSAVAALVLPGRVAPRFTAAAAIGAFVVALAAPTAWAIDTVATPHDGAIVTAGPTVQGSGFGPGPVGMGGPGGAQAGRGGNQLPGNFTPPNGGTGPPPNLANGAGQRPNLARGAGNGAAGAMGGLLGGGDVSDELASLLASDASDYRWVAATTGSNNASIYQLATEEPVMPIGGFNGSDPSPTVAEFEQYVTSGDIHYYISSGLSGANSMNGSDSAQAIATWVEQNFTATTVGGVTVYDLTTS